MNKNFDDGLKIIKAIRKKIKNKSNKKYIMLPPLQSTLYIRNNLIKNDVIFGSQNGAKNRENSLFNLIFLTILTYKAPIWDHKTTVQF